MVWWFIGALEIGITVTFLHAIMGTAWYDPVQLLMRIAF